MSDKVIFRTDRWHDFLSRESRGLSLARPGDTVADAFTDEVFARIYTGDEPIAPATLPDLRYARWALSYHEALSRSPAFQKFVSACKGSALNTAIAIDSILSEVHPEPEESKGGEGEGGGEGGEGDDQGQSKGKGKGQGKGQGKSKAKGQGGGGKGEPGEDESEGGGQGQGQGQDKGQKGKGKGGGESGDDGEQEEQEQSAGGVGGDDEQEPGEGDESDGEGDEPDGEGAADGGPGDSPGGETPGRGYGTGKGREVGGRGKLIDLPRLKIEEAKLEKKLTKALSRAQREIESVGKAVTGLAGAGVKVDATGQVVPRDIPAARALGMKLRENPELAKIVALAGKMKLIAARKRASKVVGGNETTVGVERAIDVNRLLPMELGRLADPDLVDGFLGDYAEAKTLGFKKVSMLRGGHGPIVMVLDKSSSMQGQADQWQSAIALTMLAAARKGRRPFAVIGFGGTVQYVKVVQPGEPVPVETILRGARASSTDIGNALAEALTVIEKDQKRSGKLGAADIILITDGQSSLATADATRARAKKLGVTIIGLAIGQAASVLLPWTDDARGVTKLDTAEDGIADVLFAPHDPKKVKETKTKDEPKKKEPAF